MAALMFMAAAKGLFGAYGAVKSAQAKSLQFTREAQAVGIQSQFENSQLAFSRDMADLAAEDARLRGNAALVTMGREGKQLYGAQRVALAAQGIDISSGSAFDVQESTRQEMYSRIQTQESNVWREVFGFEAQANVFEMQRLASGAAANLKTASLRQASKDTMTAGLIESVSSLLGGGMKAGEYYNGAS